jgi:hypothetical protein
MAESHPVWLRHNPTDEDTYVTYLGSDIVKVVGMIPLTSKDTIGLDSAINFQV